MANNELLAPGTPTPASGYYECDCRQAHRWSTDIAGHSLPHLPAGCSGTGWRLAEERPVG